jgi:hypothetical protein
MNKKNILSVVALVAVAGVSFFGGMKYTSSASSQNPNRTGGQGRVAGTFRQGAGGAGGANGNFVNGQILSKDDKSITISLQGGGSKIVFISDSTMISKSAAGTKEDLSVGTMVLATGQANPDGSVNGQNIQIRPNLPRANNQ